jgi:hypothetical protein
MPSSRLSPWHLDEMTKAVDEGLAAVRVKNMRLLSQGVGM